MADPVLSLHWLPADTPARLGLAVSRKVDTRAVGRNRIKRVLREQFRALRQQMAPGSYVAVARTAAAAADTAQLRATLVTLLHRAGALPSPGAPGTMPAPAISPDPALPRRSSPPVR